MAAPVVRSAGFGASSPPDSASKPTASPEPVMPTLPEVSYVDEFSQFDQTFGSYNGDNRKKSEHSVGGNKSTNDSNNNNNNKNTMWDVMLSLYLPVLLLWLRRSMFGTANLVRSLILGHCLRIVFSNFSEWMSGKAPSWLAVTLQSQANGSGKLDPQAWPPPALVALALLTVFTLVVHPDGFTWVMVGKLRDFMSFIFHSSTQCWNLVVQDYGVVPTVAAAATFAVLLFLSFCIVRTLAPRGSSRGTTRSAPERKKKKRKGQARHRGGNGGGGGQQYQQQQSGTRIKSDSQAKPTSPSVSTASVLKPSIPENSPPDLTPLTPVSSCAQTVDPISVPCPEMRELPKANSLPAPVSFISSPSTKQPYEKERRSRVSSVSTLDTSALSDDQSCESASVRSVPSVSASSSRSAVDQEAPQPPQKEQHHQQRENQPSKQSKPNTTSNRRNKKNGKGKSPKRATPASDTPLVASSRWDALKPKPPANVHSHHSSRPKSPNHQSGGTQYHPHGHNHSHNNNHHHGNSNNNNNHHNHQHQAKHHGRGGGRNNRKGGRQQHHHNQNQHHFNSAAANSFFAKNNHAPAPAAVRSNSPVLPTPDALPRPRSPVSPPALASKRMDGPLLATATANRVVPPPGLGPLPSSAAAAAAAAPMGTNPAPPGIFLNSTNNHPVANRVAPVNTGNNNNNGDPLKYVSHSFLNPSTQWNSQNYNMSASVCPTPTFSLPHHHHHHQKVKENPFAPDNQYYEDSQIEADLQELGGQMAGSILDF